MHIDTNEPKKMRFNVNIQGVDFKQLQGSVKFKLEGVEYGFPVDILKDHISVDVPPLDDIIKKGLNDGEMIECQLDVFGEGFYMNPWTGQFELKRKATVEATMVYDEVPSNSSSGIRQPKITLKEDNILEDDSEKSKISLKEDINDGNETEQLIKLLEKLVSKRLNVPEGTTITDEEIADLSDEPPKVQTLSSVPDKNKNVDMNKGILGKRGKRNIVVEPPKRMNEKKSKNIKIMDSLVEKFLQRSQIKDVSPQKRKLIENKIKNKILKMNESKKKPQKKQKIIESKKPQNKYKLKELGDQISKSDLKYLFESVGMTKETSQKRMIDVARKMGSDDISEIYHTIKRIVKPSKQPSSYEDFVKATSSQ